MFGQPHDVLSDAHLGNLAVVLQLDLLHFNFAIDRVDALRNVRSLAFETTDFAHELSIGVLGLADFVIGPSESLGFAVDHGLAITK